MPAKAGIQLVLAVLLAMTLSPPAQARLLGRLGEIEFKPCRLHTAQVPGSVEAECARITLPENAAAPGGRKISVRLALLASRASKPAPDPVVLLAGGPGQSAVEAYPMAQGALGSLLARRHILLVEQRGTGESNPLKCPLPDWKKPQAQTLAAARGQALACLSSYDGKADTHFYTTDDYIADLEQVRVAAGVAQFNLVGGSYGTRVALEYLRRHPASIRSAFIDSVVPPGLALGQDHARNLDDAIEGMSARCTADKACAASLGDIGARLRALKAQVEREPRTVTIANPRTHEPESAPFDAAALVGVARLFSYAPETIAVLPLLVSEAAKGRPEALLAQAELIYSSLPDQLAHGLELSVICAEDADLLQMREEDRDTLMGNDFTAFIRAQCEVWPHATRAADFKQPVVSSVPVLLLSGQNDPVTPPRYAEQVAKTLSNSRHLVAKGQGHTPMGAGCMPRLIREFIEKAEPQKLDAGCLEALGDAPFFIDAQGPSP